MRIRTLLTTALLAALPLTGAVAKDAALAKAVASEHRTPAFVERDKYRHPQEVLEFAGIKPTHDGRRDLAGRRLLDRDSRPVPEGQGHVLHGAVRAGHGELEQEARRQQGALGRRQGHRVHQGQVRRRAGRLGRSRHHLAQRAQLDGRGLPGRGVRRVLQGAQAGRHPERGRASRVAPISRRIRRPPTATCARITRSRWRRRPASSCSASSEALANPKDTKDWPKGVWTLPPTLTLGETDRAKYQAIGEADNFLLKFQKPK